MSLIITFVNLGFAPNFFQKWVVAFASGFVVSLAAVLIAVPLARRLVKKVTVAEETQKNTAKTKKKKR